MIYDRTSSLILFLCLTWCWIILEHLFFNINFRIHQAPPRKWVRNCWKFYWNFIEFIDFFLEVYVFYGIKNSNLIVCYRHFFRLSINYFSNLFYFHQYSVVHLLLYFFIFVMQLKILFLIYLLSLLIARL